MTGYSGKPLAEKLGIKPNANVTVINAPPNYRKLLGKLPAGVTFSDGSEFVHVFAKRRGDLERHLSILRKNVVDTGTVWVSWPKKTSGVATDITEDTIRAVALPLGFVDVKVCAVNETWSGLKLMIRKENRK